MFYVILKLFFLWSERDKWKQSFFYSLDISKMRSFLSIDVYGLLLRTSVHKKIRGHVFVYHLSSLKLSYNLL